MSDGGFLYRYRLPGRYFFREAIIVNMKLRFALCGLCAGAVTGLLGSGGGMLLIPLLTLLTDIDDIDLFPCSVLIILPLCITSLLFALPLPRGIFHQSAPYLLGSILGGLIAGILWNRVPVKWLHRILGILILWGGMRILC